MVELGVNVGVGVGRALGDAVSVDVGATVGNAVGPGDPVAGRTAPSPRGQRATAMTRTADTPMRAAAVSRQSRPRSSPRAPTTPPPPTADVTADTGWAWRSRSPGRGGIAAVPATTRREGPTGTGPPIAAARRTDAASDAASDAAWASAVARARAAARSARVSVDRPTSRRNEYIPTEASSSAPRVASGPRRCACDAAPDRPSATAPRPIVRPAPSTITMSSVGMGPPRGAASRLAQRPATRARTRC